MANAITFCATGKTGLGHLRRITNIAQAVRERAACPMDLLTNAPASGLAQEEIDLYRRIDIATRGEMARRLLVGDHGPVVVDTAVLPGLHAVARPLCLILRETVRARLGMFRLEGGRPWDLIVLPQPAGEWGLAPEAVSARRIESVGYIYRSARLRDPDSQEAHAPSLAGHDCHVLIASGGGGSGDGAAAFRQETGYLVGALREAAGAPIRIVQALGPRAPDEAAVPGVDAIWRPEANLHEAFTRADLVVSTAGYNSVLELAGADVPVLLIPAMRTYDDQAKRGRQWEQRLGLCHHPEERRRSVRWMAEILASRRRRAPVDLGPSGAAGCAELLMELYR